MPTEPQIYCPQCQYRPRAEDRWHCIPSCGTSWHTFWTGGVCPGCGHSWKVTQCPACAALSAHKAWYHFPKDPPESKEEELGLEHTEVLQRSGF